jgi:hypothetical protein
MKSIANQLDRNSLKISLLVTGQIRDRQRFELIADAIIATMPRFDKIVFSSWTDQVEAAREIFSSRGADGNIDYCDSRRILPLSPNLNRDVMSFIAQHQQIALGLHRIGSDSHVVRIRCDAEIESPNVFMEMIDLIASCWRQADYFDKTLILGASFTVPYFFEDRFLMLSPKAAASLRDMTLDSIYSLDYFNLFPEFILYSRVIGGARPTGQFHTHDHRYSRKQPSIKFSDYDFAVFGPTYPQQVIAYLDGFQTNVSFMRQLAVESGQHRLYDRLFPSVPFDCFDFWAYYKMWTSQVDEYMHLYASWVERGHRWSASAAATVESEKQSLNFALTEYFQRRYDTVIALSKSCKSDIFKAQHAELEGCSLFLLGDAERATDLLLSNFADGHRGFEQMFYLVTALASAGDVDRLKVVAREFVSLFGNDERCLRHLRAISAGSGIKLDLEIDQHEGDIVGAH